LHIAIGLIALICIITLVLVIKRFYQLPDPEVIKNLIEGSAIDSIEIQSRIFRIKRVFITQSKFGKKPRRQPQQAIQLHLPLYTVKSPMVGTFYCDDRVTGDPHIIPGESIKKGDLIGIIVAMHLENEIVSEYDGIAGPPEIPNNSPIEFGQVIMRIFT